MIEDLRSRFIRETETVIDKLREKMDMLLEEAGQLEEKINDHREMLQLLKRGVIPQEGNITNGAPVEVPERVVVEGAGEKVRKERVDIDDETFIAEARKLTQKYGAKGFTAQELGKILGQAESSPRRRLGKLEKKGHAKMIQEASKAGPGGREPARWRVS